MDDSCEQRARLLSHSVGHFSTLPRARSNCHIRVVVLLLSTIVSLNRGGCSPGIEGIFRLQGTQVLENGFTPDGPGPGALELFSAQLFSFRLPASNDSEAFDDAVATMVHSSLFSQ